jgi:hypothetical protein
VALAWIVVGRLSIDYAERLGDAAETPSWEALRTARPLRRGWLFRDGEARAVALLVRAQFRFDQRFRLTVLSIVPLTIVYLLSGLQDRELDPFAPEGGGALVSLAVMLFPPMLRSAVGQSEAYRAAWVFHGTPASKPGLVLALKRIIVVGFIAPYLLLLGVGYAMLVGRPAAMILHMVVLGLVSHLVLVLDMMLNPEVPFSHPVSRGGRSLATFVSILSVTIVGLLLHVGLRLAYATLPGTVALLTGVALLNLIAEAALRERLRGLDARAEFDS